MKLMEAATTRVLLAMVRSSKSSVRTARFARSRARPPCRPPARLPTCGVSGPCASACLGSPFPETSRRPAQDRHARDQHASPSRGPDRRAQDRRVMGAGAPIRVRPGRTKNWGRTRRGPSRCPKSSTPTARTAKRRRARRCPPRARSRTGGVGSAIRCLGSACRESCGQARRVRARRARALHASHSRGPAQRVAPRRARRRRGIFGRIRRGWGGIHVYCGWDRGVWGGERGGCWVMLGVGVYRGGRT